MTDKMILEFKPDDVVTFVVPAEFDRPLFPDPDYQPREIRIKARVSAIGTGFSWNQDDKRVYYKLVGIDKPLLTETSPLWIEESQYFGMTEEYLQ